jgi:pSer/pThr/pTyr-binding forkhead associated (FHA) protein
VSRRHCLLFYTHKQLFVKDLKSKYGTYLYSRNAQYDFDPQMGLNLIINGSRIAIRKTRDSLFSLKCCKEVEEMRLRVL